MGILLRAVITGFGLSLGKFLFDEAKERLVGSNAEPERNNVTTNGGATMEDAAEGE